MKVLVTYGSKRNGTEGLAEMLGVDLRARGFVVDVEDAAGMPSIDGYDAVVVGGALYAGRWHADARKFVKRNAGELRRRPVFLFSSGPLDESAATEDLEPTRQVRKLMARVGAEDHKTFGGRLEADAAGFAAHAMAKDHAGDWRDAAEVNHWAAHVAARLGGRPEDSRRVS
jgi:menaquinone-dependent protoporphyrinogen oxidase